MVKVICTFTRSEALKERANGCPQSINRACRRFSQERLELCEGLLNWVEIRGIRGQLEQRGASGLNGLPYTRAFVGA